MATRRTVKINNKFGLHARPAVLFCDTASKFDADVHVIVASRKADGKSIMDLMTLAATPGTEVQIEAEGADEQEAVAALEALVRENFQED
jgi:phosphocarrier protein